MFVFSLTIRFSFTMNAKGHLTVGHPVDIGTGMVYSHYEDIAIAGRVHLIWERRYSTGLLQLPPTPLGPGWTTRYFSALKPEKDHISFHAPEGNIESFKASGGQLAPGAIIRNLGTFQELSRTAMHYIVTRWDVDTGEVERYVFEPNLTGGLWRLRGIEDATGQGLDLSYDPTGRLARIRQRLEQRAIQVHYTANQKIDSLSLVPSQGPATTFVRYEYDVNGLLRAAHNVLDYTDSYQYGPDFRMVSETLTSGAIFFFKYDEKGRCLHTSGSDGYDGKTMRYLDDIGWVEVTNSLGHVTRYQRIPNGQIVHIIDSLGAAERIEYDAEGRIIARTYPNGGTVQHAYDEQGNRSKTIDTLGHETLFSYNDAHLLLTVTDRAGNLWKRTYDTQNRLTAIQEPENGRWAFNYDKQGNLIQINSAAGTSARRTYASNGDLIEATDWEGQVTRYERDALGRCTKIIDPLNHITAMRYDRRGNLIEITYPDGMHLKCRYDPGSNQLISLTRPDGQTLRYRYDVYNRLTETIDPLRATMRYQWGDEPDQLEVVENPKGEKHRFYYDEVGHLIRERGFDGRTRTYEYDLEGNCIETTDGDNERNTYTYDRMGQMTEQGFADGRQATFSYDPLGRLLSAINPDWIVRFEYDALGRLVKEQQGDVTIEHRYQAMEARTQTSLGLTLRYLFAPQGQVDKLIVNQKHTITFQHDALGKETLCTFAKALTLKQELDSLGRMLNQQLSHQSPSDRGESKRLLKRSYQYNRGHLHAVQDSRLGTLQYLYDAAERLTQASCETGMHEQFAYDATGNITHIRRGTDEQRLVYLPGGVLRRHGDTEYAYDEKGRLCSKTEGELKKWTYTWDAANRLQSVTTLDGTQWSYTYDALGRRMSKKGPGQHLRFVWDRGVIVHQVQESDNTVEATYLFDPDHERPLCCLHAEGLSAMIAAPAGTPQLLIDPEGRITWSAQYTAWGQLQETDDAASIIGKDMGTDTASADTCPLRLPGQWHDPESGLHYNRFRYYDPAIARFISPDPLGLIGGKNAYAFVPNPIEWSDPLGLIASPLHRRGSPNAWESPELVGGLLFKDAFGIRCLCTTNLLKMTLGRYLPKTLLESVETLRFMPTWGITQANGLPRTLKGAHHVQLLFEHTQLWVDQTDALSRRLHQPVSVCEGALATQVLWDALSHAQPFTRPYFD